MIRIPLSQGKVSFVDDEDYKLVSNFRWHFVQTGRQRRQRYAVSTEGVRMHRLIMNYPKGMDVDHINGDGLDNRRSNLRICTRSENLRNQNTRTNSISGYKGVTINGKKFDAMIRLNGKQVKIGSFKSIKAAAFAYDLAARKYFGEFARPNLLKAVHV